MDIHPLIAHFPIVLLIVGVVCDVVGMVTRRDFFWQMGYLLFSLGALSAIPVALTGEQAGEVAQHIDSIASDLDDHDRFGTGATLLAVVLALVRTHFTVKKRFVGMIRCVYLAVALIAAGLIAAAGYTGGHLVYHYGAGTRPVKSQIEVEKRVPPSNTFEGQ